MDDQMGTSPTPGIPILGGSESSRSPQDQAQEGKTHHTLQSLEDDKTPSKPNQTTHGKPESVVDNVKQPVVEPTIALDGSRRLQDITREQFARHYVAELGNGSEAARKLGYKNGSAGQMAHVFTGEESVRNRIAFLAEKAGLTVDRVLKNIEKHLEDEDGANMRWANDRTLEFHGVRGQSDVPRSVTNVGIVGLSAEQLAKLAEMLIVKQLDSR